MSYQDIDKEIAHLAIVFSLISTCDRFPLSYWHQRLHALTRSSTMLPTQRQRLAQLEATLRSVSAQRNLAGAKTRRPRGFGYEDVTDALKENDRALQLRGST